MASDSVILTDPFELGIFHSYPMLTMQKGTFSSLSLQLAALRAWGQPTAPQHPRHCKSIPRPHCIPLPLLFG